MRGVFLFIVRRLLSLRYIVTIDGKDHLHHDGPVLVLPNHVALVDPMILVSFLGKYLALSPVGSEKYYNKAGIKQVMDIFETVPIWDMSAGASAEDVQKVFGNIIEAMKSWRNILIYPSWQIYRQWYESIKWKQSVYKILQHLPKNTKIVAVRTRWLWGSIWSMAWDNGSTNVVKAFLVSFWYILANFIFFLPKRRVDITIDDITNELQDEGKKWLQECNNFLESFLNTENAKRYEEDIKYLKHYFYYNDVAGRKTPEIISGSEAELQTTNSYDTSEIAEETKNVIHEKISVIKEGQKYALSENSNLVLDLFFDSLDTAEIKSYIQTQFPNASNPPLRDLKTLTDLYAMAEWMSESEEALKGAEWWDTREQISLRDTFTVSETDTILSLWKRSFSRSRKDAFMWDNIFGMQKKKDVILKAYVVSHYIKKIPWDYVWIMLPSVGSATLIILATYLAGKTPVMFNWTLGKEAFDHCVGFSKVEKILTSRNFYERVQTDFLEAYNTDDRFLFLEDILKKVPVWVKLWALVKSLYLPIPKLAETAVILFTSGSESLPKAVSLTHQNVLQNIAGVLEVLDIQYDDRLIGFLPPFHSFGFTANTIMPLITGLQVVYTPDPNDAKTIVQILAHTWVTGITATPTFLKMILSLASKEDMQSVRYAVVGAEKCPESVFHTFKERVPKGSIIEWYGITECSPVVSINPLTWTKPWTVGKVIPNLDCQILGIDNFEPVQAWEQGMIYVAWSSIFNGYLDDKIDSPFEEIAWKKYYKTWDLGVLEADGFLSITGRLKRFVKIAGEMISLPFVEGVLLEKYGDDTELKIAVEGVEKDGETKIILFSIEHIEVEEVNDYMRKSWVSNLVKISEVISVAEIPLLGTGKTDYKELKKMILSP